MLPKICLTKSLLLKLPVRRSIIQLFSCSRCPVSYPGRGYSSSPEVGLPTNRFPFSRLARLSWRILKYACIIYCVNAYLVDYFVCIGPSMEPTIKSHDVVLTEHLTQGFGELRKGDLVVARSPVNPSVFICKRIVAKAGDLVRDENNNIVKVNRGHVWLEGDNPGNSVDSRRYGPVPEGLIQTKIFARIWPPSRFGFIKNENEYIFSDEELESFD